jgi:hypothetical protein
MIPENPVKLLYFMQWLSRDVIHAPENFIPDLSNHSNNNGSFILKMAVNSRLGNLHPVSNSFHGQALNPALREDVHTNPDNLFFSCHVPLLALVINN